MLWLAVLALAFACQPRPDVVTARDLVREGARYDAQRIVLTGLAQNPRIGGSPELGTYTSFTLADGTAHVPVIAPGTQDVSQGDIVEVRGVFHDQMRVGDDVLRNVVEASFLWPRRRAPGIPGAPAGPP
jgi:hypothetical protein